MQPARLATNTRKPITGQAAQQAIADGVALAYEVAKAAFGPQSGDVAIEAQFGDPITSHDGIFNLDHLHVPDPAIDMPARILIQASRSTNVHVGDGTTGAVIVASALYNEAVARLAANKKLSRMAVARELLAVAGKVNEYVDSLKIEVDDKLLNDVAVISASDEAVGSLIADTIKEVGADGGVILEQFGGQGVFNDIVSGFYFRKGFTHPVGLTDPSKLESRFEKVFVLVSEKTMSTVGDIAPILDKCIGAKIRELVLVGLVDTEALAVAVNSSARYYETSGKEGILTTIVDANEFGALRSLFMDDLALYVGGSVLNGGANSRDFDPKMLGAAKVVVNEFSSTFLDTERDAEQEATLQARVDDLSKELKVAVSPIEQEAVRGRLGRLSGRIAILRVGGSTDVERDNTKLHVEDAVAALQAAIKEGVVPGGGTTLARLPADTPFKEAFEQPFRTLLENAGRNVEWGIHEIQAAKEWFGYDLRADNEKLINLKTAGVVDPTLVIKEIVNNACSVASQLIKTTVLLPFDNREAKRG